MNFMGRSLLWIVLVFIVAPLIGAAAMAVVIMIAGPRSARGAEFQGTPQGILLYSNSINPPSIAICPPERPIQRLMDNGIASCTLLVCLGKLVCPADQSQPCYRLPAGDCNTCTHSYSTLCMTPEEAEKAK